MLFRTVSLLLLLTPICAERPSDADATPVKSDSLLQVGGNVKKVTHVHKSNLQRITIGTKGGRQVFMRGNQAVILLGGNYVVKGAPYFPPVDVVRQDAQSFAANAAAMTWTSPPAADGSATTVVPVVRLGCIFEAAMPTQDGGIDAAYAAKLEETVQAFQDEGVYVFLDNHQDGMSASNGGEGLPYWMSTYMQASDPSKSYTISPTHPLAIAGHGYMQMYILGLIAAQGVQNIQTVPGDTNPWAAFAHDNTNGEDPKLVNLGNPSVRLNNNDQAWSEGRILFTRQCNNIALRFFQAPFSPDRPALFDPYVAYIKHLAHVWDTHSNVIAIDLFNEPPFYGLPDLNTFFGMSRYFMFMWYGAVLDQLEVENVTAPVAYEDVMGAIGAQNFQGSSWMTSMLSQAGVPGGTINTFQRYANRKQLVLSFHYYPGVMFDTSLEDLIPKAEAQSDMFGGPPLYLSEFGPDAVAGSTLYDPVNVGKELARAANLGVTAVTYWHHANKNYTGQKGWFKYAGANPVDALLTDAGSAATNTLFANYQQTVRDGTYWGAEITGAGDAFQGVLQHVQNP